MHGDLLDPEHPLRSLELHADNYVRNVSRLISVLERRNGKLIWLITKIFSSLSVRKDKAYFYTFSTLLHSMRTKVCSYADILDTLCLFSPFFIHNLCFFSPPMIMATQMRKKIMDIVVHIISVLFFWRLHAQAQMIISLRLESPAHKGLFITCHSCLIP